MRAQLAVAFPERPGSERDAIARASLLHLGWMAGEVVAIRSYDRRLADYVTFAPGSEATLRELVSRGNGAIFVAGHIGNWELMARRAAQVVSLATIAKAGPDPRLNELIGRFRSEGKVGTLWREDPATGRAMIRVFREGGALGILIDQDTRVQGVFVPFFGRLAFTPRAVGDLALRFRAAVFVGTVRRRGPRVLDGHEIEIREIPYDPNPADREVESVRITAACTAALEQTIRARPSEWVWMHERWKRQPSQAPQASSVPNSRELSAG
jgi:KDO2-lipid IV(A) lauroyltransferase